MLFILVRLSCQFTWRSSSANTSKEHVTSSSEDQLFEQEEEVSLFAFDGCASTVLSVDVVGLYSTWLTLLHLCQTPELLLHPRLPLNLLLRELPPVEPALYRARLAVRYTCIVAPFPFVFLTIGDPSYRVEHHD